MQKTLREINQIKNIPKTNKNRNKKLVKEKCGFLDRVKKDIVKSKELKEKLEKQYHYNTFKPAINRNNNIKA